MHAYKHTISRGNFRFVPRPPPFFRCLVCVQYTTWQEWRKMGKAWEHLSLEWRLVDMRWMLGAWPSTNLCAINDRASFLLVKSNTVDLVNIWDPGYHWNTWWWSLVCYVNVDPSPHTSTSCPLTSFTWYVFPGLSQRTRNKDWALHYLIICSSLG